MMKQRVLYLDIVRILACLMVILMHSPQPHSAHSLVLSSISLLAAPCIGLFFMVSGALILPVSQPINIYLKHRFTKIVIPVLFWSLFYLLIRYFNADDLEELFISIISIPFSTQGCAHFWFIYVLIGLYFLAPIISAWLQKASKREIEFYLLLWLVTMCYPIINSFIRVNDEVSGILYYFAGYVGYFVLGYYLHNYIKYWNIWILAAMYILPLGCAVVCKLSEFEVDFYSVFWYLSISVVSMCVALFMVIKKLFAVIKLNKWLENALIDFSRCSFGIYLIHLFVVRDVLWRMDLTFLPNGGGILETFLIATIFSYLIVHLISRFPGAEYFVGFKRK